ncbi:Glycoside hydrolase family 92 protein [Coniochaeta hoffmannii]|uniref:Glycoside hydrolase family 92 protein n=1 Tax=Coniochaeta hoffmannii TaxID=91930 RepID=A0AA38W4I1_9PEZI|nr:Glycoside hydrolase family 92 protein [Coniochaeta hoffmannii]
MAPKRKAPETPETSASARRSTRISSSGKKSRYFDDGSDDEASASEEEYRTKRSSARASKVKSTPRSNGKSDGNKRRRAVSDDEKEEEEDDDDVYNDEEEATPEDAASDDEEVSFDESAPPKVTYTPLPKLRDTGGVPYEDTRLHKNTMLFLKDLKANNKRSWLKSHDPEFRRALKDFDTYITTLTPHLITHDPTIPELPLKDVIFRIYRDTRFSRDPTPYKPHFSAAWSRTGRKGPYAVYYLHVQPGSQSFVGGGMYHPPAEPLARLRASIDERPWRWRRVLAEEGFRGTFLEGAMPGEEGAVGEFVRRNQEGALKTKPKGFNADHRDIEMLKLKSFTVHKKVPDSVFTDKNGQEEIARILGALVGFVTHLNRIVMPDPGDDDDSEEEEDQDEEGDEGDEEEEDDQEDGDEEDEV